MAFKFEEGKMYMMPVVFGPCVTPRQKPGGGRWIYDGPMKMTSYKVVCEVSAEKLESILPEKYELISPHVVATFTAQTEIAWLAGGGYNLLHIEIPVHFKGEKDDVVSMFEPVLWEDMTDPILTGREQLGFSKLYGDFEFMHEEDGVAKGNISTNGFKFMEMVVDTTAEPEDIETLKKVLSVTGKIHFKYMPHTGAPFTEADACYSVHCPAWVPPAGVDTSVCPPAEITFCRGELTWYSPKWEEVPAQAHVLQFLADMGFKRYVGAQKAIIYSHTDVYGQHVVE